MDKIINLLINKLLTTTAKDNSSSIRDSLDKPFIKKDKNDKFILTDWWKKYIKENLS